MPSSLPQSGCRLPGGLASHFFHFYAKAFHVKAEFLSTLRGIPAKVRQIVSDTPVLASGMFCGEGLHPLSSVIGQGGARPTDKYPPTTISSDMKSPADLSLRIGISKCHFTTLDV